MSEQTSKMHEGMTQDEFHTILLAKLNSQPPTKTVTDDVNTDLLFSVFRCFPRTTKALAESKAGGDDEHKLCNRLRGAYLRRFHDVRYNMGCNMFVPGNVYLFIAAGSWQDHLDAYRAKHATV